MSLAVLAQLAAVFAWLILSYTVAKPAINKWAIIRSLVFWNELQFSDLLTKEQVRKHPGWGWKQRCAHSYRHWRFSGVQWFMTRLDRAMWHHHSELCEKALSQHGYDAHVAVSLLAASKPALDPLILESVAVTLSRRHKHRTQKLKRIHRGMRCAGGCDTRYGKRRHDHNFSGGGGLNGGWLCPDNHSCRTKPTGDHFCGMCDGERHHDLNTADQPE